MARDNCAGKRRKVRGKMRESKRKVACLVGEKVEAFGIRFCKRGCLVE